MGNPASYTTKYVTVKAMLERTAPPRKKVLTKREMLINRAANGRDPKLSSKAREAVAKRRAQAEVDQALAEIAGSRA